MIGESSANSFNASSVIVAACFFSTSLNRFVSSALNAATAPDLVIVKPSVGGLKNCNPAWIA